MDKIERFLSHLDLKTRSAISILNDIPREKLDDTRTDVNLGEGYVALEIRSKDERCVPFDVIYESDFGLSVHGVYGGHEFGEVEGAVVRGHVRNLLSDYLYEPLYLYVRHFLCFRVKMAANTKEKFWCGDYFPYVPEKEQILQGKGYILYLPWICGR